MSDERKKYNAISEAIADFKRETANPYGATAPYDAARARAKLADEMHRGVCRACGKAVSTVDGSEVVTGRWAHVGACSATETVRVLPGVLRALEARSEAEALEGVPEAFGRLQARIEGLATCLEFGQPIGRDAQRDIWDAEEKTEPMAGRSRAAVPGEG